MLKNGKNDNVRIMYVDGLRVCVGRNLKEHWRLFKEKKVDLIIEGWRGKTIVVRNDFSKDKIDLKGLYGRYPVLKMLDTGFKAVIDLPLEDVLISEIVRAVKREFVDVPV